MADWLKRRAHSRRQCSGRNESVSLGQEFAPGAADPAAHHRCKIEPVAIFEGMHQGPRYLVEAHRGARIVIGRRIGDRFHGQDAGAGIIDEGNAKPFAIGPGDEGQLRPASRTEPLAFHGLTADRAQARQGDVESAAQQRPHLVRDACEPRRGNRRWNFPRRIPHDATLPVRAGIVMSFALTRRSLRRLPVWKSCPNRRHRRAR
jgi:hypothetical protein